MKTINKLMILTLAPILLFSTGCAESEDVGLSKINRVNEVVLKAFEKEHTNNFKIATFKTEKIENNIYNSTIFYSVEIHQYAVYENHYISIIQEDDSITTRRVEFR